MKYWQEDLLSTTEGAQREQATFKKIETGARARGFEHCAYGLRVAQPFSSFKTFILKNYAAPRSVRYISECDAWSGESTRSTTSWYCRK